MKRRVLRWYDYSWSRGQIQGGGDINTVLRLLPDKLRTELALHVNLSVLKKVCQPNSIEFVLIWVLAKSILGFLTQICYHFFFESIGNKSHIFQFICFFH